MATELLSGSDAGAGTLQTCRSVAPLRSSKILSPAIVHHLPLQNDFAGWPRKTDQI